MKKTIIFIMLVMAVLLTSSVMAKTFWIEVGEEYDLDKDVPMIADIDDKWSTVYIEFLDEWHVLEEGECAKKSFYKVCYIRNEFNVSFGNSDYVRTAVKPDLFFNLTSSKPSTGLTTTLSDKTAFLDQIFQVEISAVNKVDVLAKEIMLNVTYSDDLKLVKAPDNIRNKGDFYLWKGNIAKDESADFSFSFRSKVEGKPYVAARLTNYEGDLIKLDNVTITIKNPVKFNIDYKEKTNLSKNLTVNINLENLEESLLRMSGFDIQLGDGLEYVPLKEESLSDRFWKGNVIGGEDIDFNITLKAKRTGNLSLFYNISAFHSSSTNNLNHHFEDTIYFDVSLNNLKTHLYIDDILYENEKLTPTLQESVLMFQLESIKGEYSDLNCDVYENSVRSHSMTREKIREGQTSLLGRYYMLNDKSKKYITLSCSYISEDNEKLRFDEHYIIEMTPVDMTGFVSENKNILSDDIKDMPKDIPSGTDGEETEDNKTNEVRDDDIKKPIPDEGDDGEGDLPVEEKEEGNFISRIISKIVSWFT